MTTTLTQTIHPQVCTIDGLAIRFAESEPRGDHALLLNPWPESRLASGPVQFRLYAQFSNSGDPTNDELQRSLAFNPIFLTSGIELSDDPLVPLRSTPCRWPTDTELE
jgi:hypothetical protein